MLGSQTALTAKARQASSVGAARLKFWLLLLSLAEFADLMTTRADRLQGGIEANQVSAFVLGVGGPQLYWGLKLGLVLAMALVVLLAIHIVHSFPGRRAGIVQVAIARGLQVCVLLLTVSALGNLVVLASLVPGGAA